MPEGERPPIPQSEGVKPNLPPNPITRTDNGFLRRRDDPHGLTLKERAALGLDRTLRRIDNAIGRITEPHEAEIPATQVRARESVKVPNKGPAEIQVDAAEDPLRFGSDLSPITVRIMRAANSVGEFFQRYFATPLLGEPFNLPLVRRPEYQHPHEMKVQKSHSIPRSVPVVDQKQESPYDWADPKNGSTEFQDNPVVDTTEAIPSKADKPS